jgi:hypothetical protein
MNTPSENKQVVARFNREVIEQSCKPAWKNDQVFGGDRRAKLITLGVIVLRASGRGGEPGVISVETVGKIRRRRPDDH